MITSWLLQITSFIGLGCWLTECTAELTFLPDYCCYCCNWNQTFWCSCINEKAKETLLNIYIYIYYNYKQFPKHLCVFWFGASFYRTSISSACCHYWCPCCKLENIYNVMLIYWLLSCQLFLFLFLGGCRLLLTLPLLQVVLMSILKDSFHVWEIGLGI